MLFLSFIPNKYLYIFYFLPYFFLIKKCFHPFYRCCIDANNKGILFYSIRFYSIPCLHSDGRMKMARKVSQRCEKEDFTGTDAKEGNVLCLNMCNSSEDVGD